MDAASAASLSGVQWCA